MSRLPALSGTRVIAALERAGFFIHHVKGSHHVLRHRNDSQRSVVVPVHRKDLPPGTIRAIIRQAGLTVAEFWRLL